MKVVDGVFGQDKEEQDKEEVDSKIREMLEKSGAYESPHGFLLLYHGENGDLKVAGARMNHMECIAVLETCKLSIMTGGCVP